MHWAIEIGEYDLTVDHIEGSENKFADCLTRCDNNTYCGIVNITSSTEYDDPYERISKDQDCDPVFGPIKRMLLSQPAEDCALPVHQFFLKG